MKKLLISFLLMVISIGAFADDFGDSLIQEKVAEKKHGILNKQAENLGLSDKAIEKLSPEQIVKLYAIEKHLGGHSGKQIIIPIVLFSCIATVIALGLFFNYKKSENKSRLIYKSMETGIPIPAELLRERKRYRPSDLKRGIILLSVGTGLTLALYILHRHWPFGLILIFAGIGFLVVNALDKNTNVKDQDNG